MWTNYLMIYRDGSSGANGWLSIGDGEIRVIDPQGARYRGAFQKVVGRLMAQADLLVSDGDPAVADVELSGGFGIDVGEDFADGRPVTVTVGGKEVPATFAWAGETGDPLFQAT